MRGYRVEGAGALRFAGSMAQARELRDEIVEKQGCRKKDVEISDEIEIPTTKGELIDFINTELAERDQEPDA